MNRISEGFWDSLADRVKRGGLSLASGLGNKYASGKLDAANVARHLYDGYKVYIGQTNQSVSAESIDRYLRDEVGFSSDFARVGAKLATQRFAKQGLDLERVKAGQEGRPDPSKEKPKATSRTEPTIGKEEPKEEPKKEDPKQDKLTPERAASVGDALMTRAGDFLGAAANSTLNSNKRSKRYETLQPDNDAATILFFKNFDDYERYTEINDSLADSDSENALDYYREAGLTMPLKKYVEMYDKTGLETFGNRVEFLKDASLTTLRKFGKNKAKFGNNYIFSPPEEREFRSAEPMQIVESVITEASADAELRRFFQDIAFMAFRKGEARRAYGDEMASGSSSSVDYDRLKDKPATDMASSGSEPERGKETSTAKVSAEKEPKPKRKVNKIKSNERAFIDDHTDEEIMSMIEADNPDLESLLKRLMRDTLDNYEQITNEQADAGATTASNVAMLTMPLGQIQRRPKYGDKDD